jgi:LysM repeat protein
VPAAPGPDGKIIHEVQPYQALITISDAYHVPIDRILSLNGWQEDWPLQIGQKLVIDPGHVTPSPTLTNIQKLTPEADGNYYHIVNSGETLSWIAGWYGISLADLMSWNGLNNASVIRPEQKLLLMVTPPATATPPQTSTSTTVAVTPSPSPSFTPSPTATQPVALANASGGVGVGISLIFVVAILGVGGWLWWRFSHRSTGENVTDENA